MSDAEPNGDELDKAVMACPNDPKLTKEDGRWRLEYDKDVIYLDNNEAWCFMVGWAKAKGLVT